MRGVPNTRLGKSIAAGGAGLAALCCVTVGQFEGLRLSAYRDSVRIPTICYGETRDVHMGMHLTKPACDRMLLARLDEFAGAMERCVRRPMGDGVYAAFLSLSYNIGSGAFCRSSVVRLYNAGERRGACHAIRAFNRAGGRVLAGLDTRRRKEEALCLAGV